MPIACRALGLTAAVFASAGSLAGQDLPLLHPMNLAAEARSGLYFQPLVPADSGWHAAIGLDYASMIEINFRGSLSDTAYLQDAEALRLNLSLRHDLDPRNFLLGEAYLGGSYNGFLDSFLNWYHHLFGIRYPEREGRPLNSFGYYIELPDGRVIRFAPHGAYLGDLRFGFGHRFSDRLQSVLSVTLPTNTAGEGYARGYPSFSMLNTFRAPMTDRLIYEGSFSTGFTPRYGVLSPIQKTAFLLGTSGVRWRTFGGLWSFANLYLHSPYYTGTGASQLDDWDFTIDFGWIIRSKSGREFRFGMTEDLAPAGPAIDADFRFGLSW